VTAFFVALGLEVEGRTFLEGEFLDMVCGIPDSRTEIVMLKPARRWHPPGALELRATRLRAGLTGRHGLRAGIAQRAFEVNDLRAAVDWAATEGYGLVGGIGEYEGAWRMDYARGRKGSSSH
jgi:hypothetical protein